MDAEDTEKSRAVLPRGAAWHVQKAPGECWKVVVLQWKLHSDKWQGDVAEAVPPNFEGDQFGFSSWPEGEK